MRETLNRITITALLLFSVVAICAACANCGAQQAASAVTADGIACAKAELAAVESGSGLLALGIGFASDFADAIRGGTEEALIAKLASEYGEPIAACLVKREADRVTATIGGNTPATSSGDPRAIAAGKLIAAHGWKFAPERK